MGMIWLIAIVWVTCGVIAHAGAVAYFWREYPAANSPKDWRETNVFAAAFCLCGPVGLVVAAICSGCFYRGLMFRRPKAQQLQGDR
jgi:hypothetical protein